MWTAIGDTLPLATGLALSPLAVITGIILLLGDRGRIKTAAFGLGWLVAVLVIATVALWLVDAAEDIAAEETATGVDIVQLLFAVLFLGLAALSWRKRPRGGGPAPDNKLLRRLDGISVLGALVMGLAQGFVVIKNIPLAAGAGARLGEAGLTGTEATVALVVFALVSSAGVLVPLAVALVGGHRLTPALTATRDWLEANTSPITITVLAVLGSYFLGQGLGVLG
ncbi:GAP family protein [Pseudonocardia sichuanensis]